ncbi:uncharacterized protein TRIVIDRAFT_137356, partial [Trichoderma virens Gv29-8]
MKLDAIPPELVHNIADFLDRQSEINALARCNGRLYAITNPYLYRKNAKFFHSDALAWAAKTGNIETAKKALQYGADPNASQKGEYVPLRWAVSQGHRDIVRLLIDGADANALGYLGKTPLLFAAQEGNESTFELLLERGADPFAKQDAVQLFTQRGVRIDYTDREGRTALSWAARKGHHELVQYLLKNGASVDAGDIWGHTPAIHAAMTGMTPIVETLLESGVDIECKAGDKRTMLSWAAVNGHVKTAEFLIERGADMEALDKDGRSPLVLVANAGSENMASLLIEKGANVNSHYGRGSPLSLAAARGHVRMV